MLEIIYNNNNLIAINKPHGLAVHKSWMVRNADEFALQLLRDQLGQRVYPIHRLDRKTSGVLLFTLEKESLPFYSRLFEERKIIKKYLAIVRGHTAISGVIDYALINDKGKKQEAKTKYNTLAHSELPIPLGKHSTSRYSLIEVIPETGRMHQIRKHLSHIFHPIIGDRPHGCNKQNRLFKQKWDITEMMLHAYQLTLPGDLNDINITAPPSLIFQKTASILHLEKALSDYLSTL